MNSDAIRELLQSHPFRPFVIQLSSGESYEIRHPEVIALGKNRLVMVDPETDRISICALIHITSINTQAA